jgi:hypothetical protein
MMAKLNPEPGNLTIRADGDSMVIEYRWPRAVAIPNLAFGVLAFAAAVFTGCVQHVHAPTVIFAIAGIALTYNGLKLYLNKTTITAKLDHVKVSSGPIPAGWPRTFPTESIIEFFVASPVSGKRSLLEVRPTLFLVDSAQTPHRLVDGVPSTEAAAHIRHALLDFYGLEDLEAEGIIKSP